MKGSYIVKRKALSGAYGLYVYAVAYLDISRQLITGLSYLKPTSRRKGLFVGLKGDYIGIEQEGNGIDYIERGLSISIRGNLFVE